MRRHRVIIAVVVAAAAVLTFFGPSLVIAFRLVSDYSRATQEHRTRIESANLREIRAEADQLLGQYNDLPANEYAWVDLSLVGDHIRQLEPTYVLVSPGKMWIECQGGFHHIGLMVCARSSDALPSDGYRELSDRVWLYEDTE